MTKRPTILLFDKDDASRQEIGANLVEAGYAVVTANDAPSAIEGVQDQPVDLAIIDWEQSELDGLEIACRLKEQSGFVPIVWLGSVASRSMEGFIRGTDGFLLRPVDAAQARLQVDSLLRARHHYDLVDASRRPLLQPTDALTGLYNRRSLTQRLTLTLSQCAGADMPLALLAIDLDDFRHVNDQVGFEAGDEVLRQAADRMKYVLRSFDVLCRYGGDEFVAILPHTDDVGAAVAAERLREELQVHTFSVGDEGNRQDVRLTISIGVAATNITGYDADTLLKLADEAVGVAMQTRNRVVLGGH